MHKKKTVKVQLILVTFKRLPLKEIDIYNASALTKLISIKCGIHHTPEENQVKITCNVPHLANLFPSRPEYIKKVICCSSQKYLTTSNGHSEECPALLQKISEKQPVAADQITHEKRYWRIS